MDDFYITLFSNGSTEYSDNTPTHFTTRIAIPVYLGASTWEVGLAELIFKPPTVMKDSAGKSLARRVNDITVLVECDDLIKPQIVGSDLKSLLRSIICPSHQGIHIFNNIYYLPVAQSYLRVIKMELNIRDKNAGGNMYFVPQTIPTKVVLHFRRVKWEIIPDGVESCKMFRFDKIMAARQRDGITEDLVRWEGWDAGYDSWIPRKYIKYYETPPQKPKPVLCHSLQ